MISSFRGEYFFLSNFYPINVMYNGHFYRSAESAFQAQKCPGRENEFESLTASEAKKKGRAVMLRSDWEAVKDQLMYEIVRCKFYQNLHIAVELRATGDEELVEGNTWGDTYWGVCNERGKNRLGQILMRVRQELKTA